MCKLDIYIFYFLINNYVKVLSYNILYLNLPFANEAQIFPNKLAFIK